MYVDLNKNAVFMTRHTCNEFSQRMIKGKVNG